MSKPKTKSRASVRSRKTKSNSVVTWAPDGRMFVLSPADAQRSAVKSGTQKAVFAAYQQASLQHNAPINTKPVLPSNWKKMSCEQKGHWLKATGGPPGTPPSQLWAESVFDYFGASKCPLDYLL